MISAPPGAVPTTWTDEFRTTSPSSGEAMMRIGAGVGAGVGVGVGTGVGVGSLPRHPVREPATTRPRNPAQAMFRHAAIVVQRSGLAIDLCIVCLPVSFAARLMTRASAQAGGH